MATEASVLDSKASVLDSKLSSGAGTGAKIGMRVFGLALVVGFIYAGVRLASDLSQVHTTSVLPFVLLGIALLTALGFEFVNGFHDTANAVATVIYTHSMEPHVAVVWSGAWNFIGVLVSSGAVAFGIVSLLPVELILQVGGHAGFAMVFALLIAAIIWNIGTWWLGLASLKFTHDGGLDHRSGHCQPVDVDKIRNERRGLGSSLEYCQVSVAVAAGGICWGCPFAATVQGFNPEQAALRSP